jgi:enoyl-CoA hydratase
MTLLPEFRTLRLAAPSAHVLQVTLARPEAANALNTDMGRELAQSWEQLVQAPGDIRCVVFTGAGDRHFCAGGDLKERQGMDRAAWQAQHQVFERAAWTLLELPMPTIAAVNGACFGGGLELALMADFIYASAGARFAFSEPRLGIMPGLGGTVNLPRAVGRRRAAELLLTAGPFDAGQAAAWGLVNQVFADSEAVKAAALETAGRIAANAPLACRQIKKSLDLGSDLDLRRALRVELQAYDALIDTDDRREGVDAFNAKRAPVFRGR